MHLFLSPHFDDAIYSAAGTIAQLTANATRVLILTIMGGDPPTAHPDTPLIRELHARWGAGESPVALRRDEDRKAAAIVGAEVRHMDLPDCIYRIGKQSNQPLYPDENTLWHTIHPDDWALPDLLNRQFPLTTDELTQVERLYAPLSVGGHVDHLITRQAALQKAVNAHFSVWFYEDYPYSEDRSAVSAALQQFPAEYTLQVRDVHLTEREIAAKIEGVRAYGSQISTFWQDDATLVNRVRSALVPIDSTLPTERFYEITKG